VDAQTLTTIGRMILGLVFGAAAVGKVAGRRGGAVAAGTGARAVEAFGVSPGLAGPVAALLPVAELAVATSMLWRPAVVIGAAAGLFLLVLFTCLMVLNLRRGRRPPCHCFGRVDDSPIGPGTVVRNVVLMGVAVVVLLGG
jgi:hypothetical protein